VGDKDSAAPWLGDRRRFVSDQALMRARAIYGCAGQVLSAEEKSFFREAQPGVSSCSRAISANPAQVRSWLKVLRETVSDSVAPILIDQEGRQGDAPQAADLAARPPMARLAHCTRRRRSGHAKLCIECPADCARPLSLGINVRLRAGA